ncbi:MAG: hypothetical protein J0L56_18780 [Chitinophagales bacterium]|nr:hypothetical protein [Chitinophagales bacterium]
MKVLLSFFLAFASLTIHSQDSARQHPNYIYKQGLSWRMNGQKLTAASLKAEIFKSPEAIPYYRKATTNLILGGSLVVAGSLLQFISNKKENTNTISGWDVASFTLAGTGLVYIIKSTVAKRKAIRLRNKDVMKMVY